MASHAQNHILVQQMEYSYCELVCHNSPLHSLNLGDPEYFERRVEG